MYRLCVEASAWAGASSAPSSSAPATAPTMARTAARPRSWTCPSGALGQKVLLAGDDTGPPVLGTRILPARRSRPKGGYRSLDLRVLACRPPPRLPRHGGGPGRGFPELSGEEVDDLDERVVEAVDQGEGHQDPEHHRQRRGALRTGGAAVRLVPVHRHVAHASLLIVVIVLGVGETVAGSPS